MSASRPPLGRKTSRAAILVPGQGNRIKMDDLLGNGFSLEYFYSPVLHSLDGWDFQNFHAVAL